MDEYYNIDKCYICLEKTSIYFKLNNCKCSIYCHDECFKKIQKKNKCIICKQQINDIFWIDKVNEEAENIFILKILNNLYDNYLINDILTMKSISYLLLFVIYSITVSLLTISLSFIVLFWQTIIYSYYFLKYRNKIYNNFKRIHINDKIKSI